MARVSRRNMLIGGAAALGAAALGAIFVGRRAARGQSNLISDPRGVLDLPDGFEYRIVQRAGAPTAHGHRVPARPDGMACFEGAGGSWVLMRNHENPLDGHELGPFRGAPPPEAFDPRGPGAVTRVVVDPDTLAVRSTNLVLAGTDTNCSGGPSPWGWLSCEESTNPGHGYVFLCPTDADRLQPARPLRNYGRFVHEAIAVDPRSNTAWLTEDRMDGCLYRFVPHDPERPFEGTLSAMRVRGERTAMLGDGRSVGDRLEVDWVDLPQPDSPEDTLRLEARDDGAAVMVRGEGIFFHDGSVWICATAGGPQEAGQIFRLDPGHDGAPDVLTLVAQSEDREQLDMPDNITVAPWGDVVMAEDGFGGNHLRILSTDGRIVDLARNARSEGEFCGPAFSPDGRALFFNMQLDGLTLAVTGPFRDLTSARG